MKASHAASTTPILNVFISFYKLFLNCLPNGHNNVVNKDQKKPFINQQRPIHYQTITNYIIIITYLICSKSFNYIFYIIIIKIVIIIINGTYAEAILYLVIFMAHLVVILYLYILFQSSCKG